MTSRTASPPLRLVKPQPASVLVVVTHLLGTGHLARAAAIGRGLAVAGHRVTLATGGRHAPMVPLDGLDLVRLPAVHCRGTDFATLCDDDGRTAGPEHLAARTSLLLETLSALRPEVILVELFPFGRRQLAQEFTALLEAARLQRPRPVVLVSVRDVLNPPSKPERVTQALAVLGRHVDRVLVHGDPAVSRLWDSWPCSSALAARLIDTGYVAESARIREGGTDPSAATEVLVSGGGSGAALPLYRAALGAAALTPSQPWRLLVGHGLPEAEFAALVEAAPPHAVVERARADFPALLARAAVSVSQCGYNTMVDLALAGTRAVVVPFEDGNEREQRQRAERFAEVGLVQVVPAAELGPQRLADAVATALAAPASIGPRRIRLDLEGVNRSVSAVGEAVARGRARDHAWSRLEAALRAFAEAGRVVDLWWRDDDAVADTPALRRLLALADRFGLPLALAVIPAIAEEGLAAALRDRPGVTVLQHGFAHADHAPKGQKKTELVAGPLAEMTALELETGRRRLARLFGERFLPVLVPPWNRIDDSLVADLAGIGFSGLSTFRPRRSAEAAPGLRLVNTHWDPIHWKAGGGLREPAELWAELAEHLLAALAGRIDSAEPLGLLTHHLVHDEWVWSALEDLLGLLAVHPVVRFRTTRAAFAP